MVKDYPPKLSVIIMNVLEVLADVFHVRTPENFDIIAPELKKGSSPLSVRNKLMEDLGLSRLAAGLLVEDVQKHFKLMKAHLLSGSIISLVGLFFIYVDPGMLGAYSILLLGALQFSAGYKAKKELNDVLFKSYRI